MTTALRTTSTSWTRNGQVHKERATKGRRLDAMKVKNLESMMVDASERRFGK
jgi:hypothetical protein